MKKFILAAIFPALLLVSTVVSAQKKDLDNKTPVATVASVDLKRYTGKWYEIARYPGKFQNKCVGNTTTSYTAKNGGAIAVINQCVLKDGQIGRAVGEAKVADSVSNAKFEMNFPSEFKSFLASDWNDYWIVDLDENYQYAVASDPKRQNLWVLSRTPEMKDAVYQNILRRVESLGFNPGKLTKTPQNIEVIKGEVIQKQ